MKIIGIDYSTNIKKRGLSIADYSNSKLKLEYVGLYSENTVLNCIENNSKVLVAIDAPLGWPEKMGSELSIHKAGLGFDISSNQLFRRFTDIEVKRITGKQSLDVGADKIARAAYGALNLLDELSSINNIEFNLAWNHNCFKDDASKEVYIIEVYPAVTLKQYGIQFEKYKKKEELLSRENISKQLLRNFDNEEISKDMMIADDNVLDSVVCTLSGYDFLKGDCYKPRELELAKKEGWIWFKSI